MAACSENVECLGERRNACALIGDGQPEFLALFSVFVCSFHLRLQLCNLGLQLLNLHSASLDGQFQVRNLGLTARVLALFLHKQTTCAEIIVPDLIGQLFAVLSDHVIDDLLGDGIGPGTGSRGSETWAVSLHQDSERLAALLREALG